MAEYHFLSHRTCSSQHFGGIDSANTQIISFGGKVLTLFEAGLPFRLDPDTLETLGEDTMGGALKDALPVKLGKELEDFEPEFIGGSAVSCSSLDTFD